MRRRLDTDIVLYVALWVCTVTVIIAGSCHA